MLTMTLYAKKMKNKRNLYTYVHRYSKKKMWTKVLYASKLTYKYKIQDQTVNSIQNNQEILFSVESSREQVSENHIE
jgi:hypothetical protein